MNLRGKQEIGLAKRKDKWNLSPGDVLEVQKEVRNLKLASDKFMNSILKQSILSDIDYDTVMKCAEQLYNTAQIGKLAEDNQRRHREHMKKVKKVHG